MTAVQQARLAGFNASLSQRGVSLGIGAVTIKALVEPVAATSMEFSVGQGERQMSRVHVLRTALAAIDPERGEVFIDAVEGKTHRIVEVVDHPTNIAVVFLCETAEAE